MMRRRAIDAAIGTVSGFINITEDRAFDHVWRRCWHLSCGQLIDAAIDDSQLLQLAHHLEQGCSLELSLSHVLNPAANSLNSGALSQS
jgi:hypothetical protein